jgi:integrase
MAQNLAYAPRPTDILREVRRVGRPKNADIRAREYLTPPEVEALAKAAKERGRYGHRDQLIIRMAARHGLRVSELADLRWADIDFKTGRLHVRRLKGGTSSVHTLSGEEIRGLRRLQREWSDHPHVFVTERGAPFTRYGLADLIEAAGKAANMSFPVHFHMLRHSTGYRLVNEGRDTRSVQDYLGHVGIQHTVLYTRLSAERFKDW